MSEAYEAFLKHAKMLKDPEYAKGVYERQAEWDRHYGESVALISQALEAGAITPGESISAVKGIGRGGVIHVREELANKLNQFQEANKKGD